MDLYEFPKDHIGRKTYVSVVGHSRSVPKIYTARGFDGRSHVLPEYGGDEANFVGGTGPMIMGDIGEYTSTLDGTRITSRSQHRDHMRQHGVIEVGTQPVGSMGRTERAPVTRAGHDIARALQGNI